MKQLISLLAVCFFVANSVVAQHIEIHSTSYYGVWNTSATEYFYGGGGIGISYQHPLKKGAIRAGIDYRTINWGNQVMLNLGYSNRFISAETWSLDGISTVGLGAALFRPKSLFAYSCGYDTRITFLKNKRINLYVGIGVRFSASPGYDNFGKIHQVVDFPLHIGACYPLQKKKSSTEE